MMIFHCLQCLLLRLMILKKLIRKLSMQMQKLGAISHWIHSSSHLSTMEASLNSFVSRLCMIRNKKFLHFV
ncbi:hypothetical protein CARUB_v10022485mg [Capsella rubella]|uniref:Uncharacterized protein n=1 Tax=Capsella rubella TaxID=81985 RepID=R0HYD2_9BRAS|nr:hypothetical protein CARUB_v10022485mg [Capsella rubella]